MWAPRWTPDVCCLGFSIKTAGNDGPGSGYGEGRFTAAGQNGGPGPGYGEGRPPTAGPPSPKWIYFIDPFQNRKMDLFFDLEK